MIAALIVLLVSQDAAARSELRALEPLASRIELRVQPGAGKSRNFLSDAAVRELKRWPGMPLLELHPRLTRVEARQLRKLGRFGALVPEPLLGDRSLAQARPALRSARPVKPVVERARDRWPCPDAPLLDEQDGAAPLLHARGGVTACVRDYLQRELGPGAASMGGAVR